MTTTAAEALPEAFFLDADEGQRFCLFHRAQGRPIKGRILYLHPFAEEMNASRRVVAQQCRALAACGYAVLQIDQFGCGDSSGEFGEATWQHWLQDALLGLNWLREHAPQAPTWLWGLRAGALLACETARALKAEQPNATVNLLLWQPVASGQQQLQQFLRLHAAAQWLGRDAVGEPPTQLLAEGYHAPVAGYSLSPKLARELEQAHLTPPRGVGRIGVVEMNSAQLPSPSPWLNRMRGTWESAGWRVNIEAVIAAPFWQNVVESSLPDPLHAATQEVLA